MTHPTPYTARVAIPLPSDDDLKKVMGDSYNSNALNVVKMFAGTEDCFVAMIGLVKALFMTKGVDPKLREMITLRAAKLLNAPYEWQANSKIASNAGLSATEIEAAASDEPVEGIGHDYVVACKATDELSRTGTLLDETLSRLLERFGETTTRKLLLMIGYFNLLGMFLNGCRVPLETSDKIGKETSPLG